MHLNVNDNNQFELTEYKFINCLFLPRSYCFSRLIIVLLILFVDSKTDICLVKYYSKYSILEKLNFN